jgi:mono/diheme cytochrome c family protein
VKETGVYTKDQAAAGSKEYQAKCSRCHGANLEGVSAPALRGEASGLKGDSVGQALTFVSTQMPAGDPGSLSTAEYDDIVAYILARNGHPAGATALTPASAKKSTAKL